jgi:NifU-like protein involved in Fe-S cluster formation
VREDDVARIEKLRERLWQGLKQLEGVYLNGEGAPRYAGILNVSFEGVEGESLVTALPTLAVSTGSACNSATDEPSYVLRALGRSTQLAESSLRFSLGRFTSEADADGAIDLVRAAVHRLRAVSPAALESTRDGPQPDPAGSARNGLVAAPAIASSSTWPTSGLAPDSSLLIEDDVLSPSARQYFEALPYAGAIPDTEGPVLRGEAGAAGRETWVRFHLLTAGDNVKAARFQAFGCPHTLAVTAWLTGQLPGKSRDLATVGGPMDWAQALQVPTEKLGRLLVVEDALRAALRRWP